MLDAVVGLGANLGERLAALTDARARVAALPGARLVASSRLYETAPVGPAQPDFLNAAIRVACAFDVDALLASLLAIEADLGRVRRERWGPRAIDLDVLWAPGVARASERLTVPHPRLAERAFAVLPLLDVAPEAPYEVPPGDVRVVAATW